jgi:hypothetical protein
VVHQKRWYNNHEIVGKFMVHQNWVNHGSKTQIFFPLKMLGFNVQHAEIIKCKKLKKNAE